MRITFVSLFAALFFVAACETTPEEAASTAGAGAATEPSGETGVAGAAVTPGMGGVTPESAAVAPESAAGGPGLAALAPESATLAREPAAAGRAVAVAPPGTLEDFVLNVGDTVYFNYDKSVLGAEAERTLERQAEWLNLFPGASVTVQGHADERGTREYNLALGDRRATSVKNFLAALGVPSSRISIISYGKERPAALGHNEAAWAQNRRGVTLIN